MQRFFFVVQTLLVLLNVIPKVWSSPLRGTRIPASALRCPSVPTRALSQRLGRIMRGSQLPRLSETRTFVLIGPDGQPLTREEASPKNQDVPMSERQDDVFGRAFMDYATNGEAEHMEYGVISLPNHDVEETPISYFFRSVDEMPMIEVMAMENARGRVLDVGCGAGSHALYMQNKLGLDVTGLDISPGAVNACKQRGLKKAISGDFYEFKPRKGKVPPGAFWTQDTHDKYDTLVFLMNGIGVAQNDVGLDRLLQRARALLAPGGQILMDSTDIQYMYVSEDGSKFEFDFDPKRHYYGETLVEVRYKDAELVFPWLFIDYDALMIAAKRNGFEAIFLGDESLGGDRERGVTYLAKLVPMADYNPLMDDIRNAQVLGNNEAVEQMRKDDRDAAKELRKDTSSS